MENTEIFYCVIPIIFILSFFLRQWIAIRRMDKRTKDDYSKSDAFKKTRQDYLDKIDEIKKNKK